MPNVNKAMTFSGISQGLSQGYQNTLSVEGQARRSELRTLKESREQELAQLKATRPTEQDYESQQELERQKVDTAMSQLVEQQNQNVQQQVYRGFDRWSGDHDIRHLNTMLNDVKKTDVGSRLMGDVVRLDTIGHQDADWLRQQGIDPELVLNNEELRQSIVKATTSDGRFVASDVNAFMQMSGYDRYADDRELERQRKALEIASMHNATGARTEAERQAHRMAAQQGFEQGSPEYDDYVASYLEQQRQERNEPRLNSASEREADRIARRAGERGSPEYEEAFNEAYSNVVTRDRQTARSRDLDEVETARQNINTKASEMDSDFFSLDMSERENRVKFADDMNRLIRLGDLDISASERSELSSIRRLVTLGESASELTEGETGIIDNVMVGFRRYITDNTEGLDSTSAYHAFRNTARHALHGAQLSQHEVKSMNQQFGTLGQQLGPVLTQFRTALTELQSRLGALYNTNDPYVMHYYAGMDEEQLANTMTAIEERINFIDNKRTGGRIEADIPVNQGGQPQSQQSDELSPEDRQRLENLWQRRQGGQQPQGQPEGDL